MTAAAGANGENMTSMSMTQPRPGRSRDPVLTVHAIGKRFGAVRALTDVDFWVNEGEVVALIGDNGAGKSTLVKLRSEEHTSELQSLMRISYAVFCLKKK